MSSSFYDEIVKLDAATRFQLAQDLLDSISSEAFSPPITDDQRSELRARLAYHRANTDERTVSLADIKTKLGLT
jgi:putative addiction module component (TIGR02574 family)